jgi:crotonobetainyl-CoA:carnitine CoA-transferase CaiB-like acyl-CoA transferase
VAAAELWVAGVPAAPCVAPELSARSPHHDQQEFVQWIEHSVAGWVPYFSFPFRIDGEHLPLGGPAPTLGEHTAEVLASIGLDDAEIAELGESGVTGDWPAMVPRPDDGDP